MKARTKQTLWLIFHLAIYLLAWETLITNIVTIFVKSLTITRGRYYEQIFRQYYNNRSDVFTDYLYVIKHGYTVQNCTEPIGPERAHNYNYRFLKQSITLIFFWTGQLIMITVSSVDIFFTIQQYRHNQVETSSDPTSDTKEGCCTKCGSCCSVVGSVLMKIGRIVFVSTTYAMPAYYMANFDYTAPCLTPYPALFLGDFGLIFYYVNLSLMVVISTILLWRQIRTGISETVFDIKELQTGLDKAGGGAIVCAFVTCNQKAMLRAAVIQLAWMIVFVGLFGSMIIFFDKLTSKTGAFYTSVNGALRMGFSSVVLLGSLHTITLCGSCR